MPIGFYEANAQDYFDRTVGLDVSSLYNPFTRLVPAGGHILDAGCGSGRDSLAFLQLGYEVTAFDGSSRLAKMAAELTGLPVRQMRFQKMDFEDQFDGIWACASLLHVPRSEIRDVVVRFIRALKPGGCWYMSFKHGDGESEVGERMFNNYTSDSLGELLAEFPQLDLGMMWVTPDLRPERADEKWLNAIFRRKLEDT